MHLVIENEWAMWRFSFEARGNLPLLRNPQCAMENTSTPPASAMVPAAKTYHLIRHPVTM